MEDKLITNRILGNLKTSSKIVINTHVSLLECSFIKIYRQLCKEPTWTMSLCGRCIRSGSSGSCGGSRIRMKNMTRIDETGWHKTFVTVTMSQHPKPIRIIAI